MRQKAKSDNSQQGTDQQGESEVLTDKAEVEIRDTIYADADRVGDIHRSLELWRVQWK